MGNRLPRLMAGFSSTKAIPNKGFSCKLKDYAVIKITKVDDTTVSKSGTGVIEFTYKK